MFMRLSVRATAPGARLPARRRGAAVVEFAVVAPVFFLLILGIIELGRGLMVAQLLSSGARVGCRAGMTYQSTPMSSAQIKQAVSDYLYGVGIDGETAVVTVNDGTTDASSAASQAELTVTVSVPVATVSWVPGTSWLMGSLSGQFTMRRE